MSAVASYADARQHFGQWILRIDDIDQPRTKAGAAESIIHTLSAFGFKWNNPIKWQSERISKYEKVIQELKDRNAVYFCACSRREITKVAAIGVDGMIYPGTCRDGKAKQTPLRSYRLRVASSPIQFKDRLQGLQSDCLINSVGDFVVKDGHGQHHYQLATVVDDQRQQITEVVRGADLLASTARQIHLQTQLGYGRPVYLHLPVVKDALGFKLSKQQGATAIDDSQASQNLVIALTLLAQQPPGDLTSLTPAEIVQWGIYHWDTAPLMRMPSAALPPTSAN